MRPTASNEYATKIAHLTGDDFEVEVVTILQDSDPKFQRIPRKPNGDGGLDGLSADMAYCCYGPEPDVTPGLSPTQRRAAHVKKIVEKFRDDLMLLLELEFQQTIVKKCKNDRLEGILGDVPTSRIEHVRLVCNWFEDNRIVGGVKKAFASLAKKSACRFVNPGCIPVIWGPQDLANNVRVTQASLARAEQPALVAALREVSQAAQTYQPVDLNGFNDKFDDLITKRPSRKQQVEKLREDFRQAWSKSLLLDGTLARDLPHIHNRFEELRPLAANAAKVVSAGDADPLKMLEESRERLRALMADLVHGGLREGLKEELAQVETGRLLGDCNLDWRSQ